MINEYYIFRDNEKHGPYSHTELMDMEVDATELVLSPLATDWQEAFELPEFDEYFKSIGIYVPTADNVANFGWRLLAYVIDYIIIIVAVMVIGALIAVIERLVTGNVFDAESKSIDLLFRLIGIVVLIFYNATFEATKMEGSIGKFICRLVVVDLKGQRLSFSQALQRNVSKIVSSLVCGVGFLVCLWNPMKQCWHDQIAKTFIVRKPN